MYKQIQTIGIIGAGNVATHLVKAFRDIVSIIGCYSQSGKSAEKLSQELDIPFIENLDDFPTCDLLLICTNDESVLDLINKISPNQLVAYTSGSVELPKGKSNIGVFYPLQTFSKDLDLDLTNVPFLIESENIEFQNALIDLAGKISSQLKICNSMDRKNLHIAAVFINNFTNHLIYQSQQYLKDNHLDWKLLLPLLNETIEKVKSTPPFESQTGPAKRGDHSIIENHLSKLSGDAQEIYKTITKSILNTYSKND